MMTACGAKSSTGETDAEADAETIMIRDRAADHGARSRWREALVLLEPLISRDDAALEDLLRAANAQLAIKDADDTAELARPLVERALAIAPDDPVVLWCRYRMAVVQFDTPGALEALRKLAPLAPDDYTVQLTLASTLDEFDQPAEEKEAQELYRVFLARPETETGSWRMTALYRLGQSLLRQDDGSAEALALFEERDVLDARGVVGPGVPSHEPDTLGMIPPHTTGLFEMPAPAMLSVRFASVKIAPAGAFAGMHALQLTFPDGAELSEEHGADHGEVYALEPLLTVVAFGTQGVALADEGRGARTFLEQAVIDAAPLDRMNRGTSKGSDPTADRKTGDQDQDLIVASPDGALRLLENIAGQWSLRSEPLANLGPLSGPGSLVPVDYDHDSDIDLLVATANGLKLLRNDGLDQSGGFTDATAEASIPAGDFRVLVEDLDRDNDVDFLLLEREGGGIRYLSNQRGGRFSDATSELPAGIHGTWIVPADLDGDSWCDLAVFGDDVALYLRTENGGWRSEPRRLPLAHAPTGEPLAVDWDLDGACDLVWPCAEAPAAALLAPGFANGGVATLLGEAFGAPSTGAATILAADLDSDFDLDLLRLDGAGLRAFFSEGQGDGVVLALQGHKDNARGVGAIIELRSGLRYRRLYFRGTPQLVGLGAGGIEEVRISWPNGVVQGNFGFEARTGRLIAQREGLVGSCPFLYTWNGETFEFISDVLGVTPLGLPMAPGMIVPPDHDEYVLVKGEQLVPRDGVYELQLTEELREVTYLDAVRLEVVDHPADVEIFPNERFSFPPFPEAHTHTLSDPLAPISALDQSGTDWSTELARDDRDFALPFELPAGPYQGLATPHTLELSFDPERVRDAPKLRLFLNGWFFWTDASVNMAVARHPDFAFVPPSLSVPDGEGGWRECGSIGFPAGKLKTMAIDVSELLNRDDPRVRLFSTLRLYWDSIRLAVDADDAPLVTTTLQPISANLWERGFSQSTTLLGEHECEWFVWDELEPEPRWNQHPGLYTRLGDTLPLLTESDDKLVIFGAGDALTLRFDATKAPPLEPGWRRDFLVYFDGWAKDRDPNTIEALYVEPLPFHGMSGYPYGPDEHFPDDAEHRAYRAEWNTRPATRWIEAFVPARRASAAQRAAPDQ